MPWAGTASNSIIQRFTALLWDAIGGRLQRLHTRTRLRWRQRDLPATAETEKLAFAALGGQIDRTIPYLDVSNDHLRVIALRRSTVRSADLGLFLLERFGGSMRVVWQSDAKTWLTHASKIEVADMDGDGVHEVYFSTSSFGSGAGSAELFCLKPDLNKICSVTWNYDWQNWDAPPLPRIMAGDETDTATLRMLESIAGKMSLAGGERDLDLNKPQNAVLRWHRDNGNLTSGRILTHEYSGVPDYQSTELARLNADGKVFSAHFKGPVICSNPTAKTYFVLWAPGNIYHWPTALAYSAKFLFIGTRGQGVLRYNFGSGLLVQLKSFSARDFLEVEQLSLIETIDGGVVVPIQVVVNVGIRIPIEVFNSAEDQAGMRAEMDRRFINAATRSSS